MSNSLLGVAVGCPMKMQPFYIVLFSFSNLEFRQYDYPNVIFFLYYSIACYFVLIMNIAKMLPT